MAHVYDDRTQEQCAAPSGAAAFVLDLTTVPQGFQGFDSSNLADADTCDYSAVDSSGAWEVGIGTWDETAKTLTRTTVQRSSNADAAVSFTGSVTVSMAFTATRMAAVANQGLNMAYTTFLIG